jgi:hypothetical protein
MPVVMIRVQSSTGSSRIVASDLENSHRLHARRLAPAALVVASLAPEGATRRAAAAKRVNGNGDGRLVAVLLLAVNNLDAGTCLQALGDLKPPCYQKVIFAWGDSLLD